MSRKLYKWPRPMLLIANGLIWSFPGIKILLGGIDAVRDCGKPMAILLFMMSLGITLKLTGMASVFFIAFFYCGLGAALSEAALTYIIKGICRLIR
ncbi:MAG: hypothetical protein KBS80_08380 [Bacteroidales bacterium]|nr:hypothetical protein [Candidatus Cryptobacteroides choladohippi]